MTLFVNNTLSAMPVLLMTDSRGHGLKKHLDIEAPNVFRVSARSSDTMADLFKRAAHKLSSEHERYTAVIIMGGICDITMKDEVTGVIHLREYDPDIVTKSMCREIKKGLKRIKRVSPQVPVIITPTIGLSLAMCNNSLADPQEQDTLNKIVLETNKMLISCNKVEARIPWISRTVHHCRGKGRWAHKYYYLRDGCHFNNDLKRKITRELSRSLKYL